jgi:hypothetical protein
MAFPNDRFGFPSKAEVIPTTTSGNEVAIATTKKLIVYAEMPMWRAILEEALINILIACTKMIEATMINRVLMLGVM